MSHCVLGPKLLVDDGEHIASWVDPATVVAVSEALANLDEAQFAEQYRTRLPPDYALDHGEEDLGYIHVGAGCVDTSPRRYPSR